MNQLAEWTSEQSRKSTPRSIAWHDRAWLSCWFPPNWKKSWDFPTGFWSFIKDGSRANSRGNKPRRKQSWRALPVSPRLRLCDGGLIATDINPQVQRSAVAPKTRVQLSARALRAYGLIAALIIIWVIFAALTDGIFLSPRNFSNLIRQTAVTGILSVGMVVIIVAGQIDLSVGSIVGLSGMVAVLTQVSLHLGLFGSLLIGVLVGLIVGAIQGALTAYAQIPSFI